MIRIEVKENNNHYEVESEVRIIGYDKAVGQLSTVFTTLYKNIPEKILVEALYSSEWGKHISELSED